MYLHLKKALAATVLILGVIALSMAQGVTEEQKEVIQSANKGDPTAQYSLGWMYFEGDGVSQNESMAKYLFGQACNNGHQEGCFYYQKMNEPIDEKYAVPDLTEEQAVAIKKTNYGDVPAQTDIADDLIMEDYSLQEIQWMHDAAQDGNADAQLELGLVYEYGLGILQAEAVKWYEKAATQGNSTAQYNVALMYYNGKGVSKDYSKAAQWIGKSAAQGDADAQLILGGMYYEGKVIQQNESAASKWLEKSCDNGNQLGCQLYAELNETNQSDDQEEADNYYRLGMQYEDVLDFDDAAEMFEAAAALGHADAQFKLGGHYDSGLFIRRDDIKAVELYQKAAAQGHIEAQCNLGMMYDIGKGVRQDENKALEWYKKAASRGLADAQFRLGEKYELRLIFDQDNQNLLEATKWYKKACENGSQDGCNAYRNLN